MGASAALLIAVLPVVAGEGLDVGISELGPRLVAAAAWRPGVRALDAEELFVPDLGRRLRECGSDDVCLAGVLEPLGLSLAFLVIVNAEVEPPLVALRVLDVKGRSVTAQELLPSGSVPAVFAERVARILDHLGFPEAGRLGVRGETSELSIEPPPLERSSPDTWWVAPGPHRVTAKSGDQLATSEIEIAAREERTVTLSFPEAETPLVASPVFWVGVGAGAVALAVAVVLVALSAGGQDVCLAGPGQICP